MRDILELFLNDIPVEKIKTDRFYEFPFESIEFYEDLAKIKVQNTLEITCHNEDCYILEMPTKFSPGRVKVFLLVNEDEKG